MVNAYYFKPLTRQLREYQLWTKMSWTLRFMLDRQQMATCVFHSW